MESTPSRILPISDSLRAVVRNADDNPQAVIIWDGTGGSPAVIYIEQNEDAEAAT